MKPFLKNILLALIPFGIYLLFSSYLKTWIVDDAGISFAYGRNLAKGYGLTSWPGAQPVEGFSNFLWTLWIAGLHLLHLFDPIYTPKICAAILMLASFCLLQKTFIYTTNSFWYGLLVNLFIAINAPILIWTQSGLENALYIFLIALLAHQIIIHLNKAQFSRVIFISFIAFLIAITRPEGCIYFLLFPINNFLNRSADKKVKTWMVYYTLFSMLIFGGFLVYRLFYFHDLVPNTFYAKFQPLEDTSNLMDKTEYLSFAVGGRWGKYLIILQIFTFPFVWRIAKVKLNTLLVWTSLFFMGIANFFLLPNDWMGELRFALVFIVSFYGWMVFQLYLLYNRFAKNSPIRKMISISLMGILLLYSGYHFHIRLVDFSKNPTIPFTEIKTLYTDKFNLYNQQLQLKKATLLLPDVGACLYYSNIKIYDAAGLCDKTIAKNLGKDRAAVLNYILDEIKPTFIHLHLKWAQLYSIYNDERFIKDYIPLHAKTTIKENDEFYSTTQGDFIRRDAINENNQAVYDSLFVFKP